MYGVVVLAKIISWVAYISKQSLDFFGFLGDFFLDFLVKVFGFLGAGFYCSVVCVTLSHERKGQSQAGPKGHQLEVGVQQAPRLNKLNKM